VSEKPETCYRDAAGGHYIISSESEDGTVQTEHGGDSFAPGMHVNGIPRADLKPCGCGKWTRAHEVQQREGVRKVQELAALVQAARALSPGARAGVLRAAQATGDDEGVSELKAMFAAADRLDEAETTEPLRPGHTK
jgi:hypothetical protein